MTETDFTIPQVDRFLRGVEIIRKYLADSYPLAAEHDVIYCGEYETREQMTEEERRMMDTYGWIEEYDSWAFYV